MTTLRIFLAVALICIAACSGNDASQFGAACRVDKQAELPLTIARNFLLAPVLLDGRRMLMVVDTGAESTLLTPAAVESLGLASDPGRRSVLMGVGGLVRSQNATLRTIELGGVRRTDQSVGVGEIGTIGATNEPVAGLLGTDILSRYDVELDIPGRRLALYTVSNCQGFVPWGGRGAAVRVRFNPQGLSFLSVGVDGRPVRALLDTGARASLITRRVAASIGVGLDQLADDPIHGGTGIGLASIELRQHRFDRVSVGPILMRDMPINVADLRLPGVEMLLGADWLGSRRIWISYSGGGLFIR